MEECVQLPNQHILNLIPRQRSDKSSQYTDENEGAEQLRSLEHSPEIDDRSVSSGDRAFGSPPRTTMRRTKATKLPVPRSLAEKHKEDQDNRSPGSPGSSQLTRSPAMSGKSDKDREEYWRKVRGKFEKESPLSYKNKDKPKDFYQGAYRKFLSLASSPRHEIAKFKSKQAEGANSDDKRPMGVKSKTAIPTPSGNSPQSSGKSSPRQPIRRVNRAGLRPKGHYWPNLGVDEAAHQRSSDNTTNSSFNSNSSISPVSGPGSSTDWEDRFVVHMPSAREPNPPTMNAQQIAQFQHSIEKVRRAGEDMLDPETSPSPRSTTPEKRPSPVKEPHVQQRPLKEHNVQEHSIQRRVRENPVERPARERAVQRHLKTAPTERSPRSSPKSSPKNSPKGSPKGSPKESSAKEPLKKQQSAPKNLEGPPPYSDEAEEGVSPSRATNHGRYYCPEEVGKQRCSTIWEEQPWKSPKRAYNLNSDGSFLGCKEINGPTDKNPDEILLFSAVPERPRVVDIQAPACKKPFAKSPTHPAILALEEKYVVQEEWKTITQNLKHAQCSKPLPKTMCQESHCRQPDNPMMPPKTLGTSTSLPALPRENRRDDDVFIITPTITRTASNDETQAPAPKQHLAAVHKEEIKAQEPEPTGPTSNKEEPKSQIQKHPGSPVKKEETKEQSPKPVQVAKPTSRTANANDGTVTRSKPPVRSIPSGLRPAIQKWQEKSNAPSTTPSKDVSPGTGLPVPKSKLSPKGGTPESAKSIRGYIRTPGVVKSTTDKLNEQARNPGRPRRYSLTITQKERDPAQSKAGSSSSEAGKDSPSETGKRVKRERRSTAKATEVAELDGLQVKAQKRQTLSSKITDVNADLRDIDLRPDDNNPFNSLALSLFFHVFVLAIAYTQKLFTTRYPKIALDCIVGMVDHCIRVVKRVWNAALIYNTTGAWPKPSHQDIGRAVTEFSQAVVYLITLGFLIMIVGRAAGYIVLVGNWIVWFARPFGWLFGAIGRALQA